MGQYSFFLFARPSFSEGTARILDFGDTLTEYNRSKTPEEADFNALFSDWCAVGDDLRTAMSRIEREQQEQQREKTPPGIGGRVKKGC